MKYFIVSYTEDSAPHMNKEFLAEGKDNGIICRDCESIIRHSDFVIMDEVEQFIGRKCPPTCGVWTTLNIVMMRLDCLQVLRDLEVELPRSEFSISKILDENNNEFSDAKAVVFHNCTLIRGGSASQYRECGICHVHLYAPLGNQYILEEDIAEQLPIYYFSSGSIIFREDYARKMSECSGWKKNNIKELPVKRTPVDGIILTGSGSYISEL